MDSILSAFRASARPGFCIVIAGITFGLHGQNLPTGADASVMRLDPLIVQGRDADLLGVASSASQGLVGARELAARPFFRPGELLEVIPGVVITQHSGGGKANQYFLRGFNLDHGTDFSVTVDGVPVNLRSHAHGQGYSDLNFMIPEIVGQVAYHKGPFHAETGDFSAAGAAEFRLVDVLPRGLARVEIGGDHAVRAVVADTVRHGSADTSYALEVAHDDGPWELAENLDRFSGWWRHAWTAGERRYRVTAMGYAAKWRATDQIPRRAVESGALGRFGTIDLSDGGQSERGSLSFDATIGSGGSTTHLNAYALYSRLNLFSNFTYFLDDPVNGDQFNQRDQRVVLGGELQRRWTGMAGVLTAGLQVREDLIGELGLHRTTDRIRRATVRDDRVNQGSAGVFVKSEHRWRDWLRSEIGLRADGYHFDVSSDPAVNSGTRTAGIVTPKASVVFGPWAETELYLNAGDGFHSNDARGTVIRVDPASGAAAEPVVPLVRARGYEAGVRTSIMKGWVSTLSLWALDLDSELVFVGDAGGTEASGATRRRGLEWANFLRASSWLTLDADFSLTHARYRTAGGDDRVANSIGRVITAGATVSTPGGWFGAVRLRYFGRQPLIEDNSVQGPSSTIVNVRTGWIRDDWEIALEAANLLDREDYDIAYFYASRLPGETAAGIDDLHFHPVRPLTLRASLTRKF